MSGTGSDNGWLEAAIAWEVCASLHRQYCKGKDALFTTRQSDFVKHAENARGRAPHGQAPADLSPTAGMNIPQRILHVGGRNNDAGYVEFGSIQAVEALVRQVLRDLQAPAPADSVTAPAGGVDDDVNAVALARYKVAPAHESMFHRFAVVAGDGKQQLYLGREAECENMARKLAGAFLDGAFYQSNIAPTPPAQAADSVLEDAARYRWIRGPVEESTRYSRWRIEYWDGPNGWQPMQRERMDSAIDAAIATQQGVSHDR